MGKLTAAIGAQIKGCCNPTPAPNYSCTTLGVPCPGIDYQACTVSAYSPPCIRNPSPQGVLPEKLVLQDHVLCSSDWCCGAQPWVSKWNVTKCWRKVLVCFCMCQGLRRRGQWPGIMHCGVRLQGFLDAGAPGSQLYVSYAGHAQYAQLCAGFGVCNIVGNIVCGANYSVTDRQVQVPQLCFLP